MNIKDRQALLRRLLATVLESSLGPSEFEDLARDLEFGSFSREFADLLRSVADPMKRHGYERVPNPRPAGRLDRAIAAVQKKRMSKATLGDLFRKVSPSVARLPVKSKATARDMIKAFFGDISDDQKDLFLALVEGDEMADPYLAGILKRQGR
jgi:hypothetical protein